MTVAVSAEPGFLGWAALVAGVVIPVAAIVLLLGVPLDDEKKPTPRRRLRSRHLHLVKKEDENG
jgi:hypothetical protein